MKNITFSADEELIDRAREIARGRGTTVNEEFRKWLTEYVGEPDTVEGTMQYIRELQAEYSTEGRKFTREEMNER